ncbi:unnamed protein product [Rotaria magnacalcarata]
MATTTTNKLDTRFLGLPKNRTGLFAADTIHEVKSNRNPYINVPLLSPQFRHNTSANVLLASAEQNLHQLQQYRSSSNEIQQYYPLDGAYYNNVDSSNDSRLTLSGIRNGFRPSTVRHQKSRLSTATPQRNSAHREHQESLPKSAIMQAHASAKLKSEIDHINSKLKRHEDSTKHFRAQSSRDLDGTPQSDYSYSTSCRLSSASTTLLADRIHQRFSSAITHASPNVVSTIPLINEASNETTQMISTMIPISSELTNEIDNNQQDTTEYQPTYAYQVPQQSNVGSESVFLPESVVFSAKKSRSAKTDRRPNESKPISCPFYVMYLTNLAMQQRQNTADNNNHNNNENHLTHMGMSSVTRKVPMNSRTSTVYPKIQPFRRPVNSPISVNTYSTIDDEDFVSSSTPFTNSKRLSAKTSTVDNETSHMLRDVLRTSSWNHVQT